MDKEAVLYGVYCDIMAAVAQHGHAPNSADLFQHPKKGFPDD